MSLKIIFMGTPEFAVPSLDNLRKNGYNIVGVVTAPDKLGGRGRLQVMESDVKKYAVTNRLKILQPEKLRNVEFIEELKSLNADLQIVVAFRMLPEIVWNMPHLGTLNLHGSLLPKYRGAAPINWAIMNGEKETGVTTFFLKQEIDTGDCFLQEKIPILEDDTAGDLHDKMMIIGADVVLKSVQLIEKQLVTATPQNNLESTLAPKIFQETCKINFDKTVEEVYNFIRGLSPFPTAWTVLNGETLKIYGAKKENMQHHLAVGKFVTNNKNILKISCKNGFIHCLSVQLEGKKRLDISDFLNGYKSEI